MSSANPGDDSACSAAREQWLDEACDRFEAAWKSGQAPHIADFLAREAATAEPASRLKLLHELVLIDLEYRWRAGATPPADHPTPHDTATLDAGRVPRLKVRPLLEDYAALFPEWGPVKGLPLVLVLQEYRVRLLCGDQPSPGEYAARFPGRDDVQGAVADRESAARTTDRHSDGPPYTVAVLAEPRSMQIRCPHCHNPVEIVADRLLTDLTCGVCGSSFSLVGAGAETRRAATLTKVGHYELIEQLGIGGFGSVWKARDTELDRTVAVKIPRKGQLDPQEAELFLREARAAAQLRHPHIVSVHEVGREQDTLYIVSELVRGVTLKDWLTAHRLSEREAAQLCITVAEALEHAHGAGVVHRDLKPSNIMLDAVSAPHLMDFGLAKRDVGEITMTVEGRILGTPAYMSPEQARGEGHQADRRSDIYSLGVILFELLTGELPFRGNERVMLLQVMDDPAPSPRRLNRNISRDLETITLKCLEKDPRRRYGTAADLAEELRRFLDGRPILARPVGRLERAWRWCRRQPLVAGLAASFVCACLTGAAVATYFAVEANQRAHREERERLRAERQVRITTAHRLAAQSKGVFEQYPQRSLLLAVEAVNTTLRSNEPIVPIAEEALHEALAHVGGESLSGHSRRVDSVAISRDNRWVITVSDDGTARFWDQRAKQPWLTSRVLQLVPSGEEGAAILEKRVWPGERRFPFDMSGDGRWLCIGSTGGRAYICDLHSDDPSRAPIALDAARGAVTALAFSADSERLVTAGSGDGVVKLWRSSGLAPFSAPVLLSGHQEAIRSLAMCASGRWLATGSLDGSVRLWDFRQPDPAASSIVLSEMPDAEVAKVAISPDDKWLGAAFHYISNADSPTAIRIVARIWDLRAIDPREKSFDLREEYFVNDAFAFSPDSNWVLCNTAKSTVSTWPLTANGPAAAPIRHRTSEFKKFIAMSPHGPWMAVGHGFGEISIWHMSTSQLDSDSIEPMLHEHRDSISALAFSRDGDWMVSGSDDGIARLWELSDYARRRPTGDRSYELRGHEGRITAAAFSADGHRLVTGSADGSARVWDLAVSGPTADSIVLRGAPTHGKPVVVSKDKRWLATQRRDGGVAIWDLSARDPFYSPVVIGPHERDIADSIALTADAQWMATKSHLKAKLWPAVGADLNGAPILVTKSANGVVISPDGLWLTTGNVDSAQLQKPGVTPIVADSITVRGLTAHGIAAEPYQQARVDDPIRLIAASAVSHRIVTVGYNTVCLWDLTENDLSASRSELISGGMPTVAMSLDNGWLAATARTSESVATGTEQGGPPSTNVYLCNVTDDNPEAKLVFENPDLASPFAVSSDGRWLAVQLRPSIVELWKLTARGEIESRRTLRGHESWITVVEFNADSNRMVTGAHDGVVRLWDLTAERIETSSVALRGHTGHIREAVFTPDGHWLITGGNDGDYRVWNLRLGELLDLARRTAGREFTDEERRQYLFIDSASEARPILTDP